MNVGIPLERRNHERRVGLMPANVRSLVSRGHAVFVEANAGLGSGFTDRDYAEAGAEIAYSGEEVFRRSQLVVKVAPLLSDECVWLGQGQVVMGFQHLAVGTRDVVAMLLERAVTLVAYETIEETDGSLPVLVPMSQIAGRLVAQVSARYLEGFEGGAGLLLGGVPGVPPTAVGILGGGVAGSFAARAFVGLGAAVTVLDRSLKRLQHLDDLLHGRVHTALANRTTIEHLVREVDVLVGAVLVPGARAPVLVSRRMVKQMRPRSVIVDVSIDQGGCVETSRPTTHADPVFEEEAVIHYCVPNMPGMVARTATHALSNVVLPYVFAVAQEGVVNALRTDRALAKGVLMHDGHLVNQSIAAALGLRYRSLADSL